MPWGAIALIWSPFLLDVTGNTLDLFDAVVWWDDLMHFVSWGLLCGGSDCPSGSSWNHDDAIGGTTVVWGTSDGDTVVWGTTDGDTVVWGTSYTDPSCEPVVWSSP